MKGSRQPYSKGKKMRLLEEKAVGVAASLTPEDGEEKAVEENKQTESSHCLDPSNLKARICQTRDKKMNTGTEYRLKPLIHDKKC